MPPKPSVAALKHQAQQASYNAERIARLRRKGLVDLEDYANAAIAEVKAVRAYHVAVGGES